MSSTKKRRRRRNWPLLVLVFLLVGVALFAAWQISGILYDYISARRAYAEIADNAITTTLPAAAGDTQEQAQEPAPEIPFTVDWDYLRSVNPTVIGWLWCPDTMINYPVVQHTDNEYYLTHGFNRKYNPGGALFSDFNCTFGTNLCNYVVYGHQMNDGSMFDLLNDYSDPAAYEEHPLFYFLTPEGNYRVELISAHIVEAVPESYPGYFESEEDYRQYLDYILSVSTFKTTAAIDPSRQLLTMSTCNYSRRYSDPRMLLHGLLVPIEE